MILVSVPVPLIVVHSVDVVVFIHWIIHVTHAIKDVIVCPVLVLEVLEALFAVELAACRIPLLMTLVLPKEIIVAFVILHAVTHLLLELFTIVHSLSVRHLLPFVLPVVILILIIEARACLIHGSRPKDQPVVLFPHFGVSEHRVSLSDLLEYLFTLLQLRF